MENKNKIKKNLKATLIVEYLMLFNELEDEIKKIFIKELDNMEAKLKNKLYFYFGGKGLADNIFIKHETESFEFNKLKFKENEEFKIFTLNFILKIIKAEKSITILKDDLQSIQTPSLNYPMLDICFKFINMRNVLAHELIKCEFNEGKHVVETLSKKNILENRNIWLEESEIDLLDDKMINIFSNLVYINIVLNKIKPTV